MQHVILPSPKEPGIGLRRTSPPHATLVVLLNAMSVLSPQDNASVKEPPIPVVVHSQEDTSGFRNEYLTSLGISDVNRILEREDSLRRAYSARTQKEERQFD